ncbi:MAG TPA: crossover junction endodeoxyribonuclease RuvC [Gemmatimonadaceae bacterium]|nr:crossover junction endodeoxyribonuclease RuvC [Gemmatimonadaceae bacterium]
MRVLGIDPGSAATGYGVVEAATERTVGTNALGATVLGYKLLECGVLRTPPRAELPARLRELHEGVSELIDRYRPDVVAVESVFYGRNARSALALGQARGIVLLAAAQRGREVRELPPAEIKKAVTGTGAATKEQVQYMLARLLNLREAPRPADASDGVAAAVAYLLTSHMRLVERPAGKRNSARRAGNGRGSPTA